MSGVGTPAQGAGPILSVVLHQPEIPNNTGTIGRTCVAVGAALHLIDPLGFEISEHACRRAGLDYWPRLNLHRHASWAEYLAGASPARLWLFEARASRTVFDADFCRGDHLVFGRESTGLPTALLAERADRVVAFPMAAGERSLNLANAATAAVFEAVRKMIGRGELVVGEGGVLAPVAPVAGEPR